MKIKHLEDLASTRLKRYPKIFKATKNFYCAINYYIYGLFKKKIILNANCSLTELAPHLDGSTFFGYYERHISNGNNDILFNNVINGDFFLKVQDQNGLITFSQKVETWTWQQGCLATWVDDNTIIYNDICGSKVVGVLQNVRTKERQFLPTSFQTYSASCNLYCSIDINCIQRFKPEYGYHQLNKNLSSAPTQSLQLWSTKGLKATEYSYAEIAIAAGAKDCDIEVNHCIFSPNGQRLLCLVRWTRRNVKTSSLLMISLESNKIYCLVQEQLVSHYNWLKNGTVVIWGHLPSKGYYVCEIEDHNEAVHKIQKLSESPDGHPNFYSENYILTDTYPDKSRHSCLYLINSNPGKNDTYSLLTAYQPLNFSGNARVDLHPRGVELGQCYIDSAHTSKRRLYRVNFEQIALRPEIVDRIECKK